MEIQYSGLVWKHVIVDWCLQEYLGFPSDIDLANAIDYNILSTCQFNRREIKIMYKIHGSSVAVVKGKSTKKTKQNEMFRYCH